MKKKALFRRSRLLCVFPWLLCVVVLSLMFFLDVWFNTHTIMSLHNSSKDALFRRYRECNSDQRQRQLMEDTSQLCSEFNQRGWEYILDFGSLLGVMRDGWLIPWDEDCDLSLLHRNKSVEKVRPIIEESLRNSEQDLCDRYHRLFSESDQMCSIQFKSTGHGLGIIDQILKERAPCEYLRSTIKVGQLFPESPLAHCNVPGRFHDLLAYYYGSDWNLHWKEAYARCH